MDMWHKLQTPKVFIRYQSKDEDDKNKTRPQQPQSHAEAKKCIGEENNNLKAMLSGERQLQVGQGWFTGCYGGSRAHFSAFLLVHLLTNYKLAIAVQ